MYRGAREQGVDYFDDVLGNNQEAGVLGGAGLDFQDRVTEKITPEGVVIEQLCCRQCGRQRNMTIPYQELYFVAHNGPGKPLILPQGWFRSEVNMTCYVAVPCGACGAPEGYAVHYAPEEAAKLVGQAQRSGFIPPQTMAQWQQTLASYGVRG
jgi:hypothetical protein